MNDDSASSAKQVSGQAEDALKQYARNHTAAIILHAKIIAYRSNSLEVQPSHVEEAIEIVNKSKKRLWSKDLAIIVGSAFFGTFVQGFITEFSDGNVNGNAVIFYVILGFVGMFLVFWGITP